MILLSVLAFGLLAPAQQTAGVVSFEFDWPASPVPHWSIEVSEEGAGRYDKGPKASAQTKQSLSVSAATQERLRAGYKAVVNGNCETKSKHLAQTGTKLIAYTMAGSDAWSSCSFNYSDDKGLMDALAAFQAIGETMEFGARLAHERRFDRLGLDAEITLLESEAAAGHAIEMQNIAPVLQSIVDDERVLERVRRKAARLLQDAGPAPATSPL